MTDLFIFGLGYTAKRIAAQLEARGWRVSGTGQAGTIGFEDEAAVLAALEGASHVLSSVPPADGKDPVLARYGEALAAGAKKGLWLGYLSSTGVYGDTGGAWVDETAPIGTGRRNLRAECDSAWLEQAATVFRLPGIYGPGRSVFERLESGAAKRIALPGQVFSRVHADDIASGVIAALTQNAPHGAYNLADDCPASQNALIEEACRITGHPLPPLLSLEEAALSPQAAAFYSENRRIANSKAKRLLGWRPRYRDYREGLSTLWQMRQTTPV